MWRIKRRRTKPKTEGNKVIYPKLNSTARPNRYQSRNTYLDVKCNKELGAGCSDVGCQNTIDACGNFYSCKTAPYRNPILGYRKHLIDCSGNTDLSGCGYTKDVSGNLYKDNYAKTCATHPEACYNQVIQTKQNKNGCVDESYNYSTNQYLSRRCLKFQQQEFNFLSQVPVDASGSCTKFKSCNNCQYNTDGDCDCSANGFCTRINKLPCEVKNTKCYAIYKRSNSKFNHQGAVSGGSRINRLKYQTRMKAQGRTVNGRNNVINGRRPATLYRTSKPLTLRDNTCINPPPPPSDLSYETLSGSIIVTWRAGDISKLCRIAPLTGFTIQRTGSPFGHTEPVFGNTYTYSNLPIGSYDIRVRADSYYGSSDWAYLYNIITSAIPSQILNLTGSVGNQQVQLSWSAPFDGGSPITSYEYKKNNDPWISTGVLSPTSVTIANLTNGTPYTFKVRAVNANGNGPDSNSVSLTPANVPDAPTNLTGIAGAQQVDLSWAAPSNQGGSAITNYKYNVNGGTYISIGSTNTTHNVPNLTNGTPYTFKVRAVNAIGDGNESNPISVTPIDVPAAPTALTGTAGAEQVSLSWTAPFDNGSSITDYKYNINGGTYISTGSLDPSTNVTNLTNGTSYTFKVLAVNAVGDGPDSNSVSLTPAAVPGAPTNLTGTVEEEQVQLSWTAPFDNGSSITGYKYNINGGTYISTGSLDPSTNVPNLTIGTSYTFKVLAVNAVGDGPESSPLTLTTKLFPPTNLSGVASGSTNQSTLTWTEPASFGIVASTENITYDIWVKNIDPRNPGPTVPFLGTTAEYPTTFWSLFADQLASSGVNASGSLTVGNSTYTPCAFGPSPQPPNGPPPEGQYYFIIRTRKNITASNQEIASSDYVSSGPIPATGVTPGSCPP